jgi:hypothetical protein
VAHFHHLDELIAGLVQMLTALDTAPKETPLKMDYWWEVLVRRLLCLRRIILLCSSRKGGNVVKRVIAAELVHQTKPEEIGLAVHTRPRRSGWRRVATAAITIAGLVAFLSAAAAQGCQASAGTPPIHPSPSRESVRTPPVHTR